MSYKENLLKKIEIDRLVSRVTYTMGSPDSGRRIDKEAMRRLLDMAGYSHRRERDLDLYLEPGGASKGLILVVDNDLTIYDTTVADVVLRKSPLIKEMVSIRNIIKILNDKDVVVSRKEASVNRVRQACLGLLDLSHTAADIADIALQGAASLESRYADGVVEVLAMFAEMLGYQPPPKVFQVRHHDIIGALTETADGDIRFGPAVIYSMAHNEIKLIERPLSSRAKEDGDYFQGIVKGEVKAAAEGTDVFEFLKQSALEKEPPSETAA
jgi:hypothetical protein